MSTKLSFSICQSNDCSTLKFKETTGLYNATSNVTGWNSPNENIEDYRYAKIEFFLDNVSVKVFEFENVSPPGIFPTIDTDFEYDLEYEIPDGMYRIEYTVKEAKTDDVILIATCYQKFFCNVACCVYSMLKDIDHSCDCSQDQKIKAGSAFILLKGLEYSSTSTVFNKDLAVLQKICLNSNCKNCN